MGEGALTTMIDPGVALAAVAAAALVSALALGALAFVVLAARRRLDAIEAAQAETAALLAVETRRLAGLIGDRASRRSSSSAQNLRSIAHVRAGKRADGDRLPMPLRKTVH